MRHETYIIFFTVLVDVVGFGIVIPILPFYVTEFGVSPTVVTLLFASFSFFSFLSAPFLGSLSDRIGRRPVIILSIISTAIRRPDQIIQPWQFGHGETKATCRPNGDQAGAKSAAGSALTGVHRRIQRRG